RVGYAETPKLRNSGLRNSGLARVCCARESHRNEALGQSIWRGILVPRRLAAGLFLLEKLEVRRKAGQDCFNVL
ncbi:MAG: hypothetical protein ACP5MD_09055, partial [Verrucomicrobiia bacterium]